MCLWHVARSTAATLAQKPEKQIEINDLLCIGVALTPKIGETMVRPLDGGVQPVSDPPAL
ncbi:hypothetical protein WYO_4644 [Methylobacterium sp. GXF4]|jgi:hypothetical protein|nr:hypothetical protein WYO_4644 [Methylobacterium sp. GXF4]MDF2598082.1 hypothetical protein [Methylobacterium brachiatum]